MRYRHKDRRRPTALHIFAIGLWIALYWVALMSCGMILLSVLLIGTQAGA